MTGMWVRGDRHRVHEQFVNISAARYRRFIVAKKERDAAVAALGAAWLELHDWLTLATRHQHDGPNDEGASWAPSQGAVRDLSHTLAIITDTFREMLRRAK